MPVYTVVLNDELGRVIRSTPENITGQLGEGETYIIGAYNNDEYDLVEGEPVQKPLEEREAYVAAKAESRVKVSMHVKRLALSLDKAGVATTNTLPAPSEWTKADATNAILQAAGRVRTRKVSCGNLLVMEYERLIIEVNKWVADGRNDEIVPRMLNSYATHWGHTPSAAADIIVAASDAYDDLLYLTYDKRHAGAAAVFFAESDFASVAQPYIDALDGL